MTPFQTFIIPDAPPFPNSQLPVIFYPGAFQAAALSEISSVIAERFSENNWPDAWQNGIYPFDHFHAQAHEVLGCARGWVKVQLGGPDGIPFQFKAGDVVLLPAGVAHRRLDSSADYLIIGSYPAGQTSDLKRGEPAAYQAAKDAIAQVPLPENDPVMGANGAVQQVWY